jgi:hypothetical protein
MVHEGNISAAQGRIIRKGASARGRPERRGKADSPKAALGFDDRGARIRELLKTCVLIPAIFVASAAFMWSRPVDAPDYREAVELDARFHSLGTELSRRFPEEVHGVVIEPPRREASVESPGAPSAPDATAQAPVIAPQEASAQTVSERGALEKQVYRILKRYGKPTHNGKQLAAAIVKEALMQEYDPVFVAAVIKSESAFNALATSHKGAQGLMQIMPKTGAWLADQAALPRGKLTDPGHNLKLGISYLKQLEAQYKGNRMLTLVAYNWGPGHVESASAGARRVPGEVMQYAIKILNDYRRWSSELRSAVG